MTEADLLWILDRLAAGEAAGLAIPLLVTASWAAALIRAQQQQIEALEKTVASFQGDANSKAAISSPRSAE